MRTALEILARRRGRRARAAQLTGYRLPALAPDERWQVFLVFAGYMHPNGPEEELLETAHALMAGTGHARVQRRIDVMARELGHPR